jgi:fucose permease
MYFLYVAFESGVGTWEATHLVDLGFSAGFAAAATSAFWVTYTAGRLLCAPIAARVSLTRLLTTIYLAAIAFLMLANVRSLTPVAYAMAGLMIGPIFPVGLVWATRLAPRGSNVATFVLVGAALGSIVLPAGLGRLAESVGPAAIPTGTAACGALSLAVMLLTHARTAHVPAALSGMMATGHRASLGTERGQAE